MKTSGLTSPEILEGVELSDLGSLNLLLPLIGVGSLTEEQADGHGLNAEALADAVDEIALIAVR